MALTKEMIFAIADEINDAGKSPTLASIRKALGGGSYTTISEAMTEWKAKRAAKENPLREAPPHAVAEHLQEFGIEIWALAIELSNGRLATEREGLETARAQLEAEKLEAAELADQVSAELEIMQSQVTELKDAKSAAIEEAGSLREQLVRVTERAVVSEVRATEIEKRVGDLNAELARVNGQNSELLKTLSEISRNSEKNKK